MYLIYLSMHVGKKNTNIPRQKNSIELIASLFYWIICSFIKYFNTVFEMYFI